MSATNEIIFLLNNISDKIKVISKEDIKKMRVERISIDKIKQMINIIGYDYKVTNKLIESLLALIHQKKEEHKLTENQHLLFQTKYLMEIINQQLEKQNKKDNLQRLTLSLNMLNKKINLIILLGGGSGTGKSQISTALATQLGLYQILSTDSIRHILRNFMDKDKNPTLFMSTYETYKCVSDEQIEINEQLIDNPDKLMKNKLIKGYQMQSELVQNKLEDIIDSYVKTKKSLVVEGVHLTSQFILKMWKKYNNEQVIILPFMISIDKKQKHLERFAVRSKFMTLEAKYNKYINNFENIRYIQTYNADKAQQIYLPKINNNNINKSIESIKKTIISYLIYANNEQSKLTLYYLNKVFNKISKNTLNNDNIKNYVNQSINKQILMDKYKQDLLDYYKKDTEKERIETQIQNHIQLFNQNQIKAMAEESPPKISNYQSSHKINSQYNSQYEISNDKKQRMIEISSPLKNQEYDKIRFERMQSKYSTFKKRQFNTKINEHNKVKYDQIQVNQTNIIQRRSNRKASLNEVVENKMIQRRRMIKESPTPSDSLQTNSQENMRKESNISNQLSNIIVEENQEMHEMWSSENDSEAGSLNIQISNQFSDQLSNYKSISQNEITPNGLFRDALQKITDL